MLPDLSWHPKMSFSHSVIASEILCNIFFVSGDFSQKGHGPQRSQKIFDSKHSRTNALNYNIPWEEVLCLI